MYVRTPHTTMPSDPNNLPIPGSLLLVDEHATGAHHGDIILSPKPSRDFNDPLNWSKWRKQLAFAMLMTCELPSVRSHSTLTSIPSPPPAANRRHCALRLRGVLSLLCPCASG